MIMNLGWLTSLIIIGIPTVRYHYMGGKMWPILVAILVSRILEDLYYGTLSMERILMQVLFIPIAIPVLIGLKKILPGTH